MIFGHSVEGRLLEAVDLAGATGDEAVGALLFGAIHGDEPDSAELCQRLLAELEVEPPRYRTLIVPVVNPDGLRAGRKNNARDVDLNRNFDAQSWRPEHRPGYGPGPAPGSEPETAALAALIAQSRPRVLVAVHQPLRCVNWDGPARSLAAAMAVACGYPAVASVGYATPGSFGSRYGVDAGRPVITFELPRPVPDSDWAGCLRALLHATMTPPEG